MGVSTAKLQFEGLRRAQESWATYQFPNEMTPSMLSLFSLHNCLMWCTSANEARAELIHAPASLGFRDFSLPECRSTVLMEWKAKSYIANSISLSSLEPISMGVFRNCEASQCPRLLPAKHETISPPALIATSDPLYARYQ